LFCLIAMFEYNQSHYRTVFSICSRNKIVRNCCTARSVNRLLGGLNERERERSYDSIALTCLQHCDYGKDRWLEIVLTQDDLLQNDSLAFQQYVTQPSLSQI